MIAPAPPVAFVPSEAASRTSWVLYCGYVLLTALSGWYYLLLVRPSLANDLLWAGFSTSGAQTFLGDLFQRLLQQSSTASSSLFDPTLSVRKSYDAAPTFIDTTVSLARTVLYSPLSLETALPVLRATRFDWMLRMYSQYCYVDLARIYAVSTTMARQERCDSKYKSNAAVYWEPLWRNAVPRDVLDGAYATALDVAIFAALNTSENAWWQSLWARPLLSPKDEVALWQSHGLTYWQTQVNNYYEVGLTETIEVVNALGIVQVVTIHQVARHFRGLALWTMTNSYNGIWNDLWECLAINCSLVRGASAYSDDVKLHWETVEYGIANDTPLQVAIRSYMGPFGSIDITLLPKPKALAECLAQYTTNWVGRIVHNTSLAASFAEWPSPRVSLLPTPWRAPGLSYFGGNPMCLGNAPLPFAQDQLGLYDSCSAPTPFSMVLGADALLFALVMFGPTADANGICAHCDGAASRDICLSVLTNVASWLDTSGLPTAFANTTATDNAIQRLHLTLVQFAWNGSDVRFLTQPWVESGPWRFFGYLALFDWMRGDREGYQYDSDNGSFALLSPSVPPTPLAANPLELPQHVALYVWYVLLYVTSVLSVLAFAVLLASTKSKRPRQLLHFNRVAGLVWIGRPMLLLRSATALAILSTSPMTFETRAGVSRFVFTPRSVLETMVLSGEATWATYVLVDVLLPLTKRAAPTYAPLSSLAAWLLLVFWDVLAPFQATLHIAQMCDILELGLSATCTGGRIEVGSATRFYGLLAANVLAVLLPALWMHTTNDDPRSEPGPLVAASADAFVHGAAGHLDAVGAILSGLLPLRRGFVDMSLWLRVGFHAGPRLQTKLTTRHLPLKVPHRLVLKASAGFLYVVFSVVGSCSYIYVSETALANDLWWAGFNATGHQTLLANWFVQQLQVTNSVAGVDLTESRYRDNANRYNLTDTTTVVSNLYASMLQSEVNSLPAVVRGLRHMESSDAPWIATSYCFLDLSRSWTMAVSSTRQAQCNASNGAVYFEPLLRNVAFSHAWWYPGFVIGIEAHLLTSASGRDWLATLGAPRLSIDGEVSYWRQHGVRAYETQWQNYKQLGVFESFAIATALNSRYAISLRASNASLHTAKQTSFKMQWPLASYLWAVTANVSGIGGSSLLRESAMFAFGNTTIASVLTRNLTLVAPLDPALAALEAAVGPFGTIDLRRVAFPIALQTWYVEVRAAIVTSLATASVDARTAFAQIAPSVSLFPRPTEWATLESVGGDLMCQRQSTSATFVLQFFSNAGVCSSNNQDSIVFDAISATQSLVSTDKLNATAACDHMWGSSSACLSLLVSTTQLLQVLLLPHNETLQSLVTAVYDDDTVQQLRLVQYMQDANSSSILLQQSPLFPEHDPSFHVFGFLYLLEWLRGVREVVSFEGSHGRIVTLSAGNPVLVGPVNALEVPTNVAKYARYVLLYVTSVLVLVALLTGGHVLWSRGCVHGFNLFAINRVTGLVWIGRPLLLLRSVSALCLLSTARLDVESDHLGFYFFRALQPSWPATIMAGGEATWVVFLLNDLASLYTREYTPLYAGPSSLLVWASVAVWSLVSPVTHAAAIDRRCDVPAVDAQLVCESGVVAIGSAARFFGLFGVTNGLVLGTYLLQRMRCREVPPPSIQSQLLYASAHYHFNAAQWLEGDIYYLDSASATIAGLLSVRYRDALYVLDIKKWRLHVLLPPTCTDHRARALPLPLADT